MDTRDSGRSPSFPKMRPLSVCYIITKQSWQFSTLCHSVMADVFVHLIVYFSSPGEPVHVKKNASQNSKYNLFYSASKLAIIGPRMGDDDDRFLTTFFPPNFSMSKYCSTFMKIGTHVLWVNTQVRFFHFSDISLRSPPGGGFPPPQNPYTPAPLL